MNFYIGLFNLSLHSELGESSMFKAVVLTSLLLSMATTQAGALTCDGFSFWTEYHGTQLFQSKKNAAYIYVTKRMEIDADGAPNAQMILD